MNYRKNENENLCIVPARKGSKGIKNKNIVLLKKVPLVEHTLKFAKKIKNKFDIVLSSDSKKILKIGRKYNFICDEIRPKKLSNDKALTIDVVKYEIKRLEKKFNKKYKIILLLQPTVPYRQISDIKISLNKIKSKNYDSVVSIKNVDGNHPYRMKIIKKKYLKNFCNFKKENMLPRQKLSKVYLRSGSIYMILRDKLFKYNSLVGKKTFGLEQYSKYNINIDAIDDLYIANKIN